MVKLIKYKFSIYEAIYQNVVSMQNVTSCANNFTIHVGHRQIVALMIWPLVYLILCVDLVLFPDNASLQERD